MKPDATLNTQFFADDVQIINKNRRYTGFFQIDLIELKHKLFADKWSDNFTRELFERGDAASVLPYDPKLDKVVLIEQFRIGALRKEGSPWLIECVAGMIDPGDDSPEAVIHREAKEEAGLTLMRVLPICHYWVSPGGSSERMYLFCAEVDASQVPSFAGVPEENEDIRVHVVDAQTAIAGLATGEIDNATSIMALQWLQLNHESLRAQWLPA